MINAAEKHAVYDFLIYTEILEELWWVNDNESDWDDHVLDLPREHPLF